MKIRETRGTSTLGLTGIVVMSGVIFAGLNPWWLVLSTVMILSAIGYESGQA
tara:strand:- start:306 stop:461 length:156 start_codon:yes stop_codon:yes gene_type:complete